MAWIAWFSEITGDDVASVGGKGANLGELTRAGLPVPPGFVVTTAAYDAFVAAHGLGPRIAELAALPADDAAARIAALFAGAELPGDLGVEEALGSLGADAVAVRSSATAEDLAEASFAGQQDTFLHVRGATDLRRAVVDCWASLWTARALAYRARRGIAPESVSLAVVVQVMVDADASGVMFTADPSSGRRDRTVISAAWGLGESVVGGVVSTDDHVVDRTGTIVSRHVADKAEMTVPVDSGSGTEQRPVRADRRHAPVLDDAAVVELARLGARIEEHYGTPQDVEWARSGDRFLVLRPARSPPCPTSRLGRGRGPTRTRCTSGPASSSRCPTRSPLCSPT